MDYTQSGDSNLSAGSSSTVKVVVAIDFGTTFSGFAYARKSEPDKVFKCYDWPYAGKAGAKPYCKTQTSLFYVPGNDGKFELKDWGWCALVQFTHAAQTLRHSNPEAASDVTKPSKSQTTEGASNQSNYISDHINLMMPADHVTEKVGYLATKFKLFLAGHQGNQNSGTGQKLPGDLTVERLVIDYLRCISTFVMTELQLKYGKHFRTEDVQWCVTVPAIWDERAKQQMKMCAQKAGLVKGPLCPTVDASPRALDIILEPEAASVYCQQMVRELNLKKGDKLLVADIGGGTIDLVVHMKADDNPDSLKVDEVVKSYGTLGGGTFVDTHFFNFMSRKIGCFKEFCRNNPSTALAVLGWWQGIKLGFDGHGYSAELSLPRKLSYAWEQHDRSVGNMPADEYAELRLNDSDITRIFDSEVEKIVDLINRQITGVRVLMLVGGFSASPYVRKQIIKTFASKVEDIIIPEDPGSAICHGAVKLHIQKEIIQNRIAKKTYGIAIIREAKRKDPRGFVFKDDEGHKKCRNCFDVFMRAGERVATGRWVTKSYVTTYKNQQAITVDLYSTKEMFPKFVTETESELEGSFKIDIRDGMGLGKKRCVEVRMCFGGSNIEVTAVRKNFGERTVETSLSVTFHS